MVSDLDRYERALVVAVSVMDVLSVTSPAEIGKSPEPMRAAGAILDDLDDRELRIVTLLLGAIGTWGICHLIPKVIPGQDPKDWIATYVQSAFEFLDERG